jgi:hypothetical protein
MKRKTKPKSRKSSIDVHDCAKGRMHDPVAHKVVITMPGGYIA